MKHLKKRDKEKKRAERKVNEAINKEELLKQGQLSNDSSFTVDEDAESLDDNGLLTKKQKTLDSVASSHTDGSRRSYNAMSLVMEAAKEGFQYSILLSNKYPQLVIIKSKNQ